MGTKTEFKKWLTIQLGSREHYAIPRMLQKQGQLSLLLTDSWVRPKWQPVVAKASRSLALRHHVDLADHQVRAPTLRRVAFDVSLQVRKVGLWDGIHQRNRWFQRWSAKQVLSQSQASAICFSYSYTARLPFHAAKKRGMSCILGQIDPGPLEQELVDEMTSAYHGLRLEESAPPAAYWEDWREELELADRVVVNSEWSRELLLRQGVASEKLAVIPLAYEGRALPAESNRERVGAPDSSRPLVVLFLGQVILRKGVGQLFDAIRLLGSAPIHFVFAGPLGVHPPSDIAANSRVEILGAVDRNRAGELYRSADVFLLPTLSDGFALTQLEAFAHGLPVIASKACGTVVTHGVDGLLLDGVTPESIAGALEILLDRQTLARMKAAVRIPTRFGLGALGENLKTLER